MKYRLLVFFFFFTAIGFAQDVTSNYRVKKVAVRDTVVLDSSGINPQRFIILDKNGNAPNPFSYRIDFKKGVVIFSEELQQQQDSITIEYLQYPSFLTRDYFTLDSKIIVENTGRMDKLYSLQESTNVNTFTPFDGLNTSGSISRGITIGNNQNAVVNSELDLQITGKLSDKVSIRASIQDANIPAQESGYSQSLNEFDQIFIELFGDTWNIRAGDIDLENKGSYFGRFTKKVQGISLSGTFNNADGSKISAFASGALVKGVFAKSEFVGQEGNQGPYKLVGPNGELYILVVSGSERVYVNGLLLKRGENEDYEIDYNAGEIRFNPTYPITANMRISVEYQFTDRSYTRFIGYGGGNYSSGKLDLGVYVYSESDAKNQPLQQSLTEEQVAILKAAGDDKDAMMAPSAVPDVYSENKILYKKIIINGQEVFAYSNNPDDELFNVRFTLLGNNSGNYVISNQSAINRIYEYVPPINGVKQGNYEPVIRLNAPEKIQVGGLNGSYHPSEKTKIDFEIAGSNNDRNLFSDLDNNDNDGFAGRLAIKQRVLTTTDTLKIEALGALDYVQKDFRTIERLYNVEFNRDWNLTNPLGNQSFIVSGVEVSHPKIGGGRYEFQNLNFSENFNGSRHLIASELKLKKLKFITYGSLLNSKADSISSKFYRLNNTSSYSFEKSWLGGKIALEDNRIMDVARDSISIASQKFSSYEVFSGIGDSTNVFVELGYQFRVNDSVRNKKLQKVNSSNTFFLKSRLINSENTQLSAFANYRTVKYEPFSRRTISIDSTIQDELVSRETEKSLNSRILYNQMFFDGGVRWNTTLESNNGVIAQQEYTYVKTDPGQGIYMWIDYNNNGIQELEEFEVAQFQDQAEYIRVLLPNQVFLKIRQNKFSQILTLNPQAWSNKEGFRKLLSHFYNQTSYILDRKVKRKNDGFNINPFKDGGDDQLGLTLNFRNALFFNRGKQYFTTSYTYIATSADNLLTIGLQKNNLESHQLNFSHKFWEAWLFNFKGAKGFNESLSENFESRNYFLESYELNPKISYLLNRQTRFDVFFNFKNNDNQLGDQEKLKQQTLGFSFAYSNAEKVSINGEFNYINNKFSGSAYSPVAYQMLEGLQPGTNFTWRALLQKRITKYLDANLSYNGRKSETTKTVHTGSVQLRAYF
ncbi:hypothetical protein [Aequorivita viscosa]|uniref:Outer membrane protein beta-barrel family protein n=1 Tax=Aequorivita viscosa TaxID=797419 RepID=A0A1M6I6B3_9FLAO|nr:hypothetical protein [Aequorivita viscosa]SDW99960.1 hypothetical protein SAMN05216556_11436 [Aequorivita viscosa]SHJ29988.1 hypothetical protein SAMN04487908_11341 [Aequorivita viscosa]